MVLLSCERSCFQCPICTAPATVNEIPRKDSGYILLCTFCGWDSTEINFINQDPAGFKGEMAVTDFNGKEIFPITELKTNLKTTQQLIAAGREPYATTEDLEWSLKHQLPNGEERFQMLRNFLANQIADTSASSYDLDQAMSYASPGSFTRIMGLYSNIGGTSGRKKPKPDSMREAYERVEGFQLLLDTDDQEIQKLKSVGWTGTLSIEQQQNACTQARFVSEGRPFVPLLKSRRSKRCRSCKHILVKPDSKTQSTRFRIKLVATNYIPTIKMQPLQPDQVKLRSLVPLRPFLMVLTLHNPLFDPVRVTLATPPHTPGNFSSKVTILCPQFEIGQNTDVWDEALSTAGGREKRRSKAEIADGQAEAGKIWEQGRNWTSVIVEIVPASLNPPPQLGVKVQSDRTGNPIQLSEDEDVLEIPMFVRVEYESESHGEDRAANGHDAAEKDQKEKREQELVAWLNNLLQLHITKVEQCGTGAALCQVFDSIYLDMPMSKVKFNVNTEYAYLQNFKILQNSFTRHQIDRPIPVERLVKCKMQDNLEFLQWTKQFWDQYFPGGDYDATARRKSSGAPPSSGFSAPKAASAGAARRGPTPTTATARTRTPIGGATSSALAQENAGLKETVTGLERERDFYFSKLRDIELLIQQAVEADPDLEKDEDGLVKHIQSILYSTEEGFEIPAEAGEGGDDLETF
ncbi:MAG: hypothetical protein M1814_003331 [Vezdaea aestivalis]|nr:MAG: hypothetical protein M1814_003331 [Vezdaea aestivalis]